MCSVTSNLKTFPWSSELLATFARAQAPAVKFSSLALFRNNLTVPHRDSHNCPQSTNQVFAISNFSGGGVIIQDPTGEQVLQHAGCEYRGRVIPFVNGMLRFAARDVVHWTEAWQGDRVVLVSYTIRSLTQLSSADQHSLLQAKFALPGSRAQPLRNPSPKGLDDPSPKGVMSPDPSKLRSNPAPTIEPGGAPMAIELFSGRGRLSQQLRRVGFSVVSFDARLIHSLVPVCKIDLATLKGQNFVWSLLDSCKPAFVHLGLPSDTCNSHSRSSRALRSTVHPFGCPEALGSALTESRLAEANRMYQFAFAVAVFCLKQGIPFCLENPTGSHVWQIFASLARTSTDPTIASQWGKLGSVSLHTCMFGGNRAKPVRLMYPGSLFSNLGLTCNGQHSHKVWLQRRSSAEIAEDASYPQDLCVRMTSELLKYMQALGHTLPASTRLHDHSLASLGVQTRRFKPLIPEYREVIRLPKGSALPQGAKFLSASQLQGVNVASISVPFKVPAGAGEVQSGPSEVQTGAGEVPSVSSKVPAGAGEVSVPSKVPAGAGELPRSSKVPAGTGEVPPKVPTGAGEVSSAGAGAVPSEVPTGAGEVSSAGAGAVQSDEVPRPGSDEFTAVGLWHSPSEFFAKACSLAHPMDTTKPVAMVTKAAIDSFLHKDAAWLAKQRKEFLDHLEKRIERLRPQEEALHASMPCYMQGVLKDKNLLAWEEILKETSYPDLDCVQFMKEGVRLVGCEKHPESFLKKVVPATLSVEELRATARHRRESLATLDRGNLSETDAKLLAEATNEEVEAGFLMKGMSASEVSKFFGHDNWGVVRRFVLVQDGGRKVRPIDDCLEAQLNAAFSATIALQLHDSDYISSLALFVAERLQGSKLGARARWLGKCLDLSKAYKQMAVHPRDRDLCVIMVQAPRGEPTYHICNSLMFGASASVFAFVRVSRTLWWIMNRCLGIPGGFFFDDYPLFAPEAAAESVDHDISRLLDLLGWKHAKSGAKGKPFQPSFDVLGMNLDLGSILEGKIVLANKTGRAEKILEKVALASAGNGSFRQSLQVLMGHLNFASGFFAGRALRHVAYDLNQLMNSDWLSAKESLESLESRITTILQSSPPRSLQCSHTRQPILVWTDGSWEAGKAGIGAVEWDTLTKTGGVWAGMVPQLITELWTKGDGMEVEQIISQVELYAMALLRHLRHQEWMHRRIILFCDNESARYAAIKGGSSSSSMNLLVQAWDHPNFCYPAYIWVERVPSYSNISDGPSRGYSKEALTLVKEGTCRAFDSTPELDSILTSRRRKIMG